MAIEGETEAKTEGQEAVVVVAEPEVKTEGGETKVEPKVEPKPQPKAEDWRVQQLQRRVDKLTAQKRELEAAVVAKQAAGVAPNVADEKELARVIEARAKVLAEGEAQKIAAQREFDEACNKAVREGREAYGEAEYNERVKQLTQLRGDGAAEDVELYSGFISALIETGDAPKLIWELSQDLNEAHRLMRLSPLKQGIALAKLAAREPTEISKAPKPITPVASKGRSHSPINPDDRDRSDNLSIAEWMARRELQAQEVNKKYGRRVI